MKVRWRFIVQMVGIGLCAIGCSDINNVPSSVDTSQEQSRVKVTTRVVEPGDITITTQVLGSIEAWSSVEVSAERPGRIERLEFDTGEAVTAGQLLAAVDWERAEIGVRDASAALEFAGAELRKIESLTRPQELRIAEANLKSAESRRDLAQKEYDRVQSLMRSNNASQSQFDAAKTDLEIAQRNWEASRQAYELAAVGSRSEDITMARLGVERAGIQLDIAYDDLDKAMVNSPLDGWVSRRHVELGEVVNAGTPLATIVDIARVKVMASIAQEDVSYLREDTPVHVELDALSGERFEGRVHVVDWVGDPVSRTFRVEVELNNPERRIRPGMMGRVTFTLDQLIGAKALRADWLWERDGKLGVFIVESETARFRPLKLGRFIGDEVIVEEGIEFGESLVIVGPEGLEDGQTVSNERSVQPVDSAGEADRGG